MTSPSFPRPARNMGPDITILVPVVGLAAREWRLPQSSLILLVKLALLLTFCFHLRIAFCSHLFHHLHDVINLSLDVSDTTRRDQAARAEHHKHVGQILCGHTHVQPWGSAVQIPEALLIVAHDVLGGGMLEHVKPRRTNQNVQVVRNSSRDSCHRISFYGSCGLGVQRYILACKSFMVGAGNNQPLAADGVGRHQSFALVWSQIQPSEHPSQIAAQAPPHQTRAPFSITFIHHESVVEELDIEEQGIPVKTHQQGDVLKSQLQPSRIRKIRLGKRPRRSTLNHMQVLDFLGYLWNQLQRRSPRSDHCDLLALEVQILGPRSRMNQCPPEIAKTWQVWVPRLIGRKKTNC
mmetsp:Transcript_25520/g.61765  ORF Transcript_25520/g.61765 Transcript_25520/m.61765 type:complete len:350 (+) Transcript_25520:573-1622(+)